MGRRSAVRSGDDGVSGFWTEGARMSPMNREKEMVPLLGHITFWE